MIRSRLLPLLLLGLAVGASAQEDYRSDFIVGVQTPEGEPIAGATVLVGGRGASTNAEGEATLRDLAPGRHRVQVSFLGYETRTLVARLDAPGPWGLIVELDEGAVGLDEVVVEARDLSRSRLAADGFFDRLDLGLGRVLTREEIERKAPIRLGDALTGLLGVRIVTNRVSAPGDVPGRSAVATRRGAECQMAIYLDGVYSPFLTDDVDAITAQDVVAIEVYRGPTQIPTFYNQLGRGEGCGVILVWTSNSLSDAQ
ncbi:carboxypeptidase-like regulatory domain-containing protein [Rubrivirga marina]|uniref:TonB-dependent receptor plug domain-containing protein n=1 Tax=Rubrivirga marina TaxID=1196024 RepID=A0A271J5S2_9BACT|nr:TonB-dependent receptor [Rubrivirga marina]PAP78305.1 hypothetical protein BSZ37_18675 [Rubrivirga marina]